MTDKSDGRVPAAQDAMKKTPEELATWAVERKAADSFRQSIVQREYDRRAAVSARRAETVAIVAAVAAVVSAAFAALAWLHPLR
jgi:hypothetical protein